LEAFIEPLRAAGTLPTEPAKVAGLLVRDGLLTNFQVEQLLQGKWRRFTIGKYKVLERLGAGGMGSVYLCEHKFMRRRVAVKVLPAAKAEDPSALERFYREARAVAALDHPNIVRAYDIDQDDKLHFLVMEYVDGTSMQDLVKRYGPMDVLRAAHYIRQSAVGLQHAHEAGLVHRDIKPGNLLLDRNGIMKVLDMGLARFFHDEADDLTKKHDENVLGTADYLAPEQALDSHSVDIRADIYSLGATFYFLLTGNTPFNEGTVAQKLIWHQTRQPKSVRAIRPDVPAEVEAVLVKMMAKDPGHRYQTPAELMEALTALTQTPIPRPPEHEMPRLCPAAMSAGQGETGTALPPLSPSAIPTTPLSRSGPPSPPRGSRPSSGSRADRPATPRPQGAPAAAAPPATKPPSSRKTGNGRTPNAVPEVMPAGDEEGTSPWEQLAPETADPSARADTSPRSARSPRQPAVPAAVPGLPWRPFWLISGAAVLLIMVGAGAYVVYLLAQIWFNDPTAKLPPHAERRPLLVSQRDSGAPFKTLRDALLQAKSGDRIILQDEVIKEPFPSIDARIIGLSIEAGPNGTEWQAPDNQKPDEQLVALTDLEGLKLRRIRFNGRGRTTTLVTISGRCPGLVLEDVLLEGFSRKGLVIANCVGDGRQNVEIRRLRTVAGEKAEASVVLDVNDKVTNNPVNTNLAFHECRFEGPCEAGILIKGAVADSEVARCRFFRCEDGILVKKAAALRRVGLQVFNNTFYEIKGGGIRFEVTPTADSRVGLANNLFARAGYTVSVDPPEKGDLDKGLLNTIFANPRNNARTDGTREGNVFPVHEVPGATLSSADPANPRFLLYDGNSPLAQGAEGPVGVPP
jgi:serine/threonine protein kinase